MLTLQLFSGVNNKSLIPSLIQCGKCILSILSYYARANVRNNGIFDRQGYQCMCLSISTIPMNFLYSRCNRNRNTNMSLHNITIFDAICINFSTCICSCNNTF
ncbi:hypothetical protein KP509_09G010800 [Ceratopteris richardii]|uniref:Uncharacterized protein n=1 Tax=Ceratopteris richardii TaxID=49495 RepID=A0A8T2U1Y5_CERRI|nr:hypothetical protein KP509_09G010800 [Ceratopteris richardii]